MTKHTNEQYNAILSIAGSDSGGCAGIQADIKSISANGGYAATVITATTAQNTVGVTDIHAMPIAHLNAQLEAVLSDIEFSAIKIGMLHSVEVIETVKQALLQYNAKNIVLDPVMVATSGDRLINDEAVESLKEFLPFADLITPNIPEASILIGHTINHSNLEATAKEIGQKYQVSVLLKGGHLDLSSGAMTDVLYNQKQGKLTVINNPSIDTNNTHGTGCTLSSSIATQLGKNLSLEEAVQIGCGYINGAIASGKNKKIGNGNGPVDHFFNKVE